VYPIAVCVIGGIIGVLFVREPVIAADE
jgi:hypothetical protein